MQNLLSNPIPEEEGEEQEAAYESGQNLLQINATVRCAVSNSFEGENITTKRIDKRDHVCNSCNSKHKKRSEVKQRHCFRCGISLNESNVGSKFHCICIGCKGLTKVRRPCYSRLTSEPNGLVNAVKS